MLYDDLKYFLKLNFLIAIYKMVLDSKIRPETSDDEWLKTLAYMQERGWLHYGKDNGKVVSVVGAYRVKDDKNRGSTIPEKEEGDYLFVNFVASRSKNNMVIKTMLSDYLNRNKNIKEILLYKEGEDLKRIKVNKNGKK